MKDHRLHFTNNWRRPCKIKLKDGTWKHTTIDTLWTEARGDRDISLQEVAEMQLVFTKRLNDLYMKGEVVF